MWTCRVPGARLQAAREADAAADHVRRPVGADRSTRSSRSSAASPTIRSSACPARHLRFFNPVTLTTNPIQVPRERLDPGPPPGRSASQSFTPGRAGAPRHLRDQRARVRRRARPPRQAARLDRPPRRQRHLSSPRRRRAGSTRTCKWQNGTWIIEDLGTTNGTYVDHTYERKKNVTLMHGGEVQLGELRFKLVSFARDSPHHKRARAYLAKRDGLTGLLIARADAEGARRGGGLRRLGRGAAHGRALRAPRARTGS